MHKRLLGICIVAIVLYGIYQYAALATDNSLIKDIDSGKTSIIDLKITESKSIETNVLNKASESDETTDEVIKKCLGENQSETDLLEHKQIIGGFVWDTANIDTEEYIVEEKVISEQEGDWTLQIYYPYISNESYVYTEINRSIEEEIAKVCPTENNTISYELYYEVRCLGQEYFSVLFYGMQYLLGAAHPTDIAWGVTYDVSTGQQLNITDIISLTELQSKLEQKEFIQVRGIKIEEYEAISGEEDWFHKYLTHSMDDRDDNHYNDFYLTDERVGILLAVSHAIGDYIVVEVER